MIELVSHRHERHGAKTVITPATRARAPSPREKHGMLRLVVSQAGHGRRLARNGRRESAKQDEWNAGRRTLAEEEMTHSKSFK
jgi:hypothetical protein